MAELIVTCEAAKTMTVHNHSIFFHKRSVILRYLCTICSLIVLTLGIQGCAPKTSTPSKAGIRNTNDGFFEFYGGGEEDEEALEHLNKEITDLREEYAKTLEDDNDTWTVVSKISASDRILQATVYIKQDHINLLGNEETVRYVSSYAFDKKLHKGYDALEALQAGKLSGVDLSRKIDKAFRTLEPNGVIHSTEMQGFFLDENTGDVKFIYMRVEADFGGEDYEERFYLYDPLVDAMEALPGMPQF